MGIPAASPLGALLTFVVLGALQISFVLGARNGQYRAVEAEVAIETDRDGIPDVYVEDRRP